MRKALAEQVVVACGNRASAHCYNQPTQTTLDGGGGGFEKRFQQKKSRPFAVERKQHFVLQHSPSLFVHSVSMAESGQTYASYRVAMAYLHILPTCAAVTAKESSMALTVEATILCSVLGGMIWFLWWLDTG